jgi:hypothetical protein
VARWLLELQQYDLEIHHVTGASNYLADVLSRNPAGLDTAEIKNLTKPTSIMVSAVDLKINHAICKDLKNLGTLQRSDAKLQKIIEGIASRPTTADHKYRLVGDVLCCRKNEQSAVWKPMIPNSIQGKVIEYVHLSLGHSGIEKCISQVNQECHIANLGHKVRKFVACCDTCQKVKHPNRAYDTEERSHLPSEPGELCAIDLYGSLPTSRGGVRYLLVCLDVFSKYVKLYPLRSATTKSCLNKLVNHYFIHVTKPSMILSDNGTQFQSPAWKRTLTSHGVQMRYTAIRNPQSNPAERCMREISKFSRVYCHETHKKWAELVPHMEFWMNNTLAGPTGYTPSEIMFGSKKPSLFKNILPSITEDGSTSDELRVKIAKAYERMKKRIEGRKKRRKEGNAHWEPELGDRVLLKTQPVSDAAMAVTSKFVRPYEGPYLITKVIHPSTYELADENGKIRGQFNKRSLKPYREASGMITPSH